MQVQDFSRGRHVRRIAGNDPRGFLPGIGNMSLRKSKKSRARRAKPPRKRDQAIEWNKEIPFRRDSRTRPVSGRRPDPKISIADSAIQAGRCAAYDGFDASRRSMRKQLS
ncbi:hypothetical protein C6T66_11305 [Burkholderia multivorans]|uniref:hypothetical protein n=1 Tax=Burkholderia multivorans TaxID=87883 RepID=UPI0009BC0DDA|nr:hypothetical protein [Burkholderia multivorans]MBU9688694.1 hypothetical protein [Burkholderia multivorans]PRD88739.1 hypothetical protein C6P76_08020 [Burkholderia multivorans]PRG88245.1 hypothetical protein C6T66_11305 [Burkholderia multivorans]PRG94292.1 hypothetical protein C6V04_11650 [Burkholderia multivorans]QET32782.1 hypothetical protein FOB31_23840 [Burkholderia multivorans]